MSNRTPLPIRIMALVRHALSETANENEARSAAIRVCEALARHPAILTGGEDDSEDTEDLETPPYQRTGRPSEVHPKTRAYLEWEAFKQNHAIRLMGARMYSLCLACGESFDKSDVVLEQKHIGTTHERCGEWWRDYDFSQVPKTEPAFDDDIPF